jgi:hypothetical protein
MKKNLVCGIKMKEPSRKSATLSLAEIKYWLNERSHKVDAYGGKDGYISEISFTFKSKAGLSGFSFMPSCGLRQRELKALFNRIKKVKPNLKLKT